jgi:hypothetical protein
MDGGIVMTDGQPTNNEDQPNADPRPAAVTFVTTEQFILQGARSSTIAEATGRATMAASELAADARAAGRRLAGGS